MIVLSHLFKLCAARSARNRKRSDEFPAVLGIVRSKYVPVAKVTGKRVKKKKIPQA